ncbi:MAG: antibiotic biosynthesis monooxygenase [Cyclobacteriaceae bacterium]|nr:antibiotic biosynthesis monooxygenase [Cyclobacteriaceae bacterium]
MLIRIVKMTFEPTKVDEFLEVFEESKEKIRAMKGCSHLELLQDYNLPNSFSTYSYWNSEDDLNNYRDSKLFKEVWKKTKVLFNKKPIAFSLKQHTKVD